MLRLAADTRKAWVMAVAAGETVRYMQQVQQSAEAGAELARRMAQAGNWNRLNQVREQGFQQGEGGAGHDSCAVARPAALLGRDVHLGQQCFQRIPQRRSRRAGSLWSSGATANAIRRVRPRCCAWCATRT